MSNTNHHTKGEPVTITEQNTKKPCRATGLFALLGALLCIAGIGASAALPTDAGAYATIEGPPIYSTAPGLPDGRVYEQVSPADKNGNEAGAGTSTQGERVTAAEHYALAAADGDSVLFETTGPMGETASAETEFFVAQHSSGGWKTHAVIPATQQPPAEIEGTVGVYPLRLDPSADLSHVMFVSGEHGTFATDTPSECFDDGAQEQKYVANSAQLYLNGPDPFLPAAWLLRPETPNPSVDCTGGEPVGGTPNFSTVYFTSPAQLLPEDAARKEGYGFYEYTEGVLREAGVLPNGKLDEFGAAPAASVHARATGGNQVSADGSRAFFVSPDPASCTYNGGQNDCAVDPPELYVRENGARTVLVSQSQLPGNVGEPAPGGLLRMLNPANQGEGNTASETVQKDENGSFVFASPDGSQAFFQSEDRLTSEAPEGPPGNTSPKTYDFDLETGALTYLPGVVGQIVATDTDGSALAFVSPAGKAEAAELELWSAGPGGGTVTPITRMSGHPLGHIEGDEGTADISLARMSSDGSVLVFTTNLQLPGAFNSGGFEQIYRYDAPSNTLGCVSCTPAGVTPTGDAVMSQLRTRELYREGGVDPGLVEPRGISADGDRIFFDTPDPLVPQDTNTGLINVYKPGVGYVSVQEGRDVYEWENGVVYLISSGKSPRNSFFLDSSENGDDVFFATAEGLVPGDTDGAYDVYDARVPQPGDNPPPAAVPCEGSVCQGPPNVPSPLTPPASATFSGLGNPGPEPAVTPTPAKTTTKTVHCKKNYVKRKGKCVKVKSKRKKAKKSTRGSK